MPSNGESISADCRNALVNVVDRAVRDVPIKPDCDWLLISVIPKRILRAMAREFSV